MRRVSMIFMAVAAVVIIGVDVVFTLNGTKGDTFSEIIRDFSWRITSIPWATGLVMGHWFLNGERLRRWWAWPAAFAALAILETFNLVWGIGHPFASFLVGVASGRLVWAMKPR